MELPDWKSFNHSLAQPIAVARGILELGMLRARPMPVADVQRALDELVQASLYLTRMQQLLGGAPDGLQKEVVLGDEVARQLELSRLPGQETELCGEWGWKVTKTFAEGVCLVIHAVMVCAGNQPVELKSDRSQELEIRLREALPELPPALSARDLIDDQRFTWALATRLIQEAGGRLQIQPSQQGGALIQIRCKSPSSS